ncbi:MAG: YceI family protein [Rubrivivax sp.]
MNGGWRTLALCLCGALHGVALAQPVVYVLDPQHSFVHFEVMHFGTSTLRGRIGPIDGAVELDRPAGAGSVSLMVRTATVDTGMAFFDKRLRQDDLLASQSDPVAYFVASRFVFDGAALRGVRGEITWRGVSQPLELVATRFACHTHPTLAREVCGGDFEGELKRGDFGASFGMPFVANRVRLLVQAEGIRQP